MRAIIHSDVNSFYASVEQLENPELRGKPTIVGGDEESRHGIVLTASYEAKDQGVKTGMTLWQARKICPDAIVVPPHFDLYHRYSKKARKLYYEYTDLVEPFGLDEAWLDITHSCHLFGGDPVFVAQEISERMKSELGLRVSVGLSWNKIFAKFGSDYKKPDGFTVIGPEDMEKIIWPSAAKELLYVGPATASKLARLGIVTIGQLAACDSETLQRLLGKPGLVLKEFACGRDISPVRPLNDKKVDSDREVKSIGNGITLPFDAEDDQTVKQTIWLLGESVCQRLRAKGLEAKCVGVGIRDAKTLGHHSLQKTLERPTNITSEFCQTAAALALQSRDYKVYPARGFNVRATRLQPQASWVQLDFEGIEEARDKRRKLDEAIDTCRSRFGNHCVRRGIEIVDTGLQDLDPQKDNVTHPVSFFA